MIKITIYWAGPVFTQAERIWNRLCVEYLEKKGYLVILPQDEAKEFRDPSGKIDFKNLAQLCKYRALSCDIMVAILDGSDADSGTSLEAGLRIREGKIVIGVRTDFRGSEDDKLNAMFRLLNKIIYFPSFNESFEELCDQIDEEIKKLKATFPDWVLQP